MADKCSFESTCGSVLGVQNSVCIHTKKICDSCIDKDCIEDLRVFLTRDSQAILEQAVSAKARSAELIYVSIDVEPTQFNTGHFTVDITYYYRILVDATVNGSRPYTLCGLAVFSKRVILCGGESEAKIFTSKTVIDGPDTHQMMRCSNPEAVVEVVDPMVLASRVVDMCNCNCCENTVINLPSAICACFEGELVLCGESRRLYVTIGQFSIIRMERDTQLRIPNLGYCIPTKQCAGVGGVSEQAPCDVFDSIDFPVGSFFPPCGEGECGSVGGVSSGSCCTGGTVGGVSTGTNNCWNNCCNNNCCGNNCCNNNCCNNNCCNTCGSNCCGTVGGATSCGCGTVAGVSTGTTSSSCGSCSTGCGTTGTVGGASTGTTTVGCGSCSHTCGSTGTVGGVSTGTTTVGCGSCKTCK